jgi:N-glycosidase YbiA
MKNKMLVYLWGVVSITTVCAPSLLGLPIAGTSTTVRKTGFEPQSMVPGQEIQGTWYDAKLRDRGGDKGKGVIYFYHIKEPFYEFSNYYEPTERIMIDGFSWPTTEQYFQAGKFTDMSIRDLIRRGENPKWAAKKPHDKNWGTWAYYVAVEDPEIKAKAVVRPDWFKEVPNLGMQRNINRMLVGLRAKFKDKRLAQMLLQTYPKILVFDYPKNGYWGSGHLDAKPPVAQGEGQNLLGRLLMHVRRELYTGKQKPVDVKNDFSLDYLLTGQPI